MFENNLRLRISALLIGLALTTLFAILAVQPVRAQCPDRPQESTCFSCHSQETTVVLTGEWHTVHALKDCCAHCHGGNCAAADKEQAHVGMIVHPLQDIYTNCYHCHPDDYVTRAERFAALLGVTPDSSATPTPHPAMEVPLNPVVIQEVESPGAPGGDWSWILAGLLFTFLLAAALAWQVSRLRSQEGSA